MALQDFTYRLKPQSGDTTPHDELGSAGDLSGGTITLVDLGGGDYAWQFAGQASATGPSKTPSNLAAGGGITVAVRMAVTAYDASSFAYLVGYTSDTTPTYGMSVTQAGTDVIRAKWDDGSDTTVSIATVNNAVQTLVLRLQTSATSAQDYIQVWRGGVTGTGDNPDYTSTGINVGATLLDTIFCGSSGSTIRVADFVLWGEELSDADCHALAEDGIRATLDAGASGAAKMASYYRMLRSA